jgi:hypothetical protein
MAARTRKVRHDENTRAKIKTSQLVNRLTAHVLGTVEMSPSQVTAGLGLLKKTLPDLQAVEHSGDQDNPIALTGLLVSFVSSEVDA